MPLPTDGFTPDRLIYHMHVVDAFEIDIVALEVHLGDGNYMSRDQAAAIVATHMTALHAELRAALGPVVLQLLVEHHGTRMDDITPPAEEPPA